MFSESLKIKLSLQINDKKFEIPGGNIKLCELNLQTFGFEGKVGFGLFTDSSKDEIFSAFVTHDLIKVQLSIIRVLNLRDKSPVPLEINAYVTQKSVREFGYREVKNEPVLERYYEISFQDIPAILWKQHFPVKLYTDKKFSDVLKDQIVEDISLEIDESVQGESQEMLFLGLGLGQNRHKASFYDFLIWYVHSRNIVFFYDYDDCTLKLSDEKAVLEAVAVFRPVEVAKIQTFFSESFRHNTRILNVHSEKHQSIEIPQDQAVSGIFQDVLMRTALENEIDDRKTLETTKLETHLEKIEMVMKEFPSKNFTIGTMVKFEKEYWSKNNLLSDKNFRIFTIKLSAKAREQNLSQNYNLDYTAYAMEMSIGMEIEDNPEVYLPPFKNPCYPVLVEGNIVSESGEDLDKTYQISQNEATSQDSYTVHVPLWDLNIKANFLPKVYTGHFYFPAFKHVKVLLALYFTRAKIKNFLDWGNGSKLPMDIQGNHLLFGKNELSETSMKYLYSEGKPVFSIQRTSDKETEMISLEQESIILQTKEDK
ncbi:MAG: hypothetical protein GY710_04895 [Desulfobacteraceae bacterium]|nr:hypothetical protein [Desulfobacteraceae bacterium]